MKECPMIGCDKIHPHIHTTVQILEAKNKVLQEGLEACEIYLRETGAIGLAVEMKNILAKAKSTESGGGQ